MKKFILLQVFAVVFFSSCEKDPLPESQSGAVAFVSNVNFNGNDFEFIAGENGIVLEPEFQDFGDSIHFNSAFVNSDCPSCGPELRMILHSPDTVNTSTVQDWIGEIQNWEYALELSELVSSSFLNLELSCGNNFSQGIWSLNDVVQNNGVPSNTLNISVEEGSYSIGFENEDLFCLGGGDFDFDFNGDAIPCYGSIDFDPNSPNVFMANPGPGFEFATTTFTWLVDGMEIVTFQDSTLVLAVAPAADSLCVTMDDAGGCFTNVCVAIPQTGADCVTNLSIENSSLSDTTFTQGSSGAFVEIQFIDNAGIFYSSLSPNQSNSDIGLLSASAYLEPSLGDTPFANTSLEVNCNLYDSLGTAFPFSGLVNIALALPE